MPMDGSTTLPLYWNLSSAVKEDRLDASVKLVDILLDFQSQYAANLPAAEGAEHDDEGSDLSPNEESVDPLTSINSLNAGDVSYAIRRLCRGLASSRGSSRLGFAVALTELLSRLNTVSSSQIVSLVLHISEVRGSMERSEIMDLCFARLFGVVSVIQSGLLYRATLPTSSQKLASSLSDFQTVWKELIALGTKKSWLRESCWWALGLSLDGLQAHGSIPWKTDAMQWIIDTVFEAEEPNSPSIPWTPDKLAITLKLMRLVPSAEWESLLASTFQDGHPLALTNLGYVGRILREAPEEGPDTSTKGKGVPDWKSQLHFVWPLILQEYCPTDGSKPLSKSSFSDFFRAAVDESLFTPTASEGRKYWGFSVVELALTTIPPSDIPQLFTRNFMRCWISHLSNKDRFLYKMARQLITKIVSTVTQHPSIGFALVTQLLGPHGNHQFDKITRTKTVENILSATDVEGVVKHIEYVIGLLRDDATESNLEERSLDSRRLWAIDQLDTLIRNPSIPRNNAWIMSIFELFVVEGFFDVRTKDENSEIVWIRDAVPLPPAVRKHCRLRLFTSLESLISQPAVVKDASGKFVKHSPASASDSELWTTKVLNTVSAVERGIKDRNIAIPLVQPSESLVALRKKTKKLQSFLRTLVEGDKKDAARGLDVLLSSLLLDTYNPDTDVEDVLESCVSSVGRLLPPEKSRSKKRKSNVTLETSDPETHQPIDEVVDVLIGLLENGTAYSRAVAIVCFEAVTPEIQRSTMDLILTQLEHRDAATNELDDGEGSEVEGGATSDPEVGSDGGSRSEESSHEDEDGDGDASGDESPVEEVEGDTAELEVLRQRVAEALQTSTNEPEDEGEEASMDDDEMLEMDDKLAEVFRLRQGPKTDKKLVQDLQREATHFKSRVLDFIEVYVRKEPTNPLVMDLVPALIEVVRSARPDEASFADKASKILKSKLFKITEPPKSNVDLEKTLENLRQLHNSARNAPSPGFLTLLAEASIFLGRVLCQLGQTDQVADVYLESLNDFVTRRKSRLNTTFFGQWIQKQLLAAWSIRDGILELCGNGKSVNAFRHLQAFQILQELISKGHSLPEDHNKAEFLSFMQSYRQVLYSTLMKTIRGGDEDSIKPNQLKEMLKLGTQAVRLSRRYVQTQNELSSIWEPDTLLSLEEQLNSGALAGKSAGLQSMVRNMYGAILLEVSETNGGSSQSKRKTEQNVDHPAEDKGGISVKQVTAPVEPKRKKAKTKH